MIIEKKIKAAYLEIINEHWEATVKLTDLRYYDLLRKCWPNITEAAKSRNSSSSLLTPVLLHFLMRFLKVIYWTSHLNIISDALMQEFHAVNQTPGLEFQARKEFLIVTFNIPAKIDLNQSILKF